LPASIAMTLQDLVVEAWLTKAQKRVANAWLEEHGVPAESSVDPT